MITIERGTILSSDVVAGGTVRLDGRLEGSISAVRVEVGPDGYMIGPVEADEIVIAGQVLGSIRARKVVIGPTALVEGDITHKLLSLDEGAILIGECVAVANVPLLPTVAALVARMQAAEQEIDLQQRQFRDEPGVARIRIARAPAKAAQWPQGI